MSQRKGFSVVSLALLMAMAAPQVLSIVSAPEALIAQTPAESSAVPTPFAVPAGARVRVDGSESLTAVNEDLKQRYEASFPGATVEVATNGSAEALQALSAGEIDIASLGRVLTEAEKAEGLQEIRLPREKIAIIVSAENSFSENLAFEAFARMFRGDITDWGQVGGTPGAIRFVDRPESSDTRLAIGAYDVWETLGGFVPGDTVDPGAEDDTDAVVAALGADGIAYAAYSQVRDRTDVTIISMHQTLPDNPAYPYSQPRVLVHTGDLSPASQAFLALASGAAVVAASPDGATGAATSGDGAAAGVDGAAAGVEGAADSTAGAAASDATPDLASGTASDAATDPAVGDEAAGAIAPSPPATGGSRDWTPWVALLLLGLLPVALKLFGRSPAAAVPGAAGAAGATGSGAALPLGAASGFPVSAAAAGSGAAAGAGVAGAAGLGTLGGMAAGGLVGAAALAALAAGRKHNSRITLAPRDAATGYAYWETPEAHQAEVKQQGGQLPKLRIYDVTGVQDSDTADLAGLAADRLKQYDTKATAHDLAVPLVSDRDYLAEVGYISSQGSWLPMARSKPIRLARAAGLVTEPALEGIGTAGAGVVAAGVGLAGAALVGGAIAQGSSQPPAAQGIAAPPDLDDASDDQSKVEGTKYNVGQAAGSAAILSAAALAGVDAGLPDLSDGYGQSRIVLMPRDPQWGYAYWDTPSDHKEALRRQGGQTLALRLYDVTDITDPDQQRPHSLQEYPCDEIARNWYLGIPVSDRDYLVEIGYLTAAGQWLMLARSNTIRVPSIYPSDWYDEQFLTLPWDENLRGKTFLKLQPPGSVTPESNPIYATLFDQAQSTEAQRVAGSLFGSMHQVPESAFGSAQMASGQAIESFPISSFITQSGVGMMGAAAGVGMGMGAVPTFSGIGMSGIGMSGIGFFGSMPPIRTRKFWLLADAELIVYGATEPDATVYIDGQPIELAPDGTFRFQMSFQDGQINFPILAVAVDGEQTRAIHMKFDRETPYRRTNAKGEAQDELF